LSLTLTQTFFGGKKRDEIFRSRSNREIFTCTKVCAEYDTHRERV